MKFRINKEVNVKGMRIDVTPAPDGGTCTVDVQLFGEFEGTQPYPKELDKQKFIVNELDVLNALEAMTKTSWGGITTHE